MGPPRVILDAPALRIVRFATHDEKEQIACDGDDVMTVMDIDDDRKPSSPLPLYFARPLTPVSRFEASNIEGLEQNVTLKDSKYA
jgi:hypothetical protein